MELRDYLSVIRRRKWVVLLTMAVVVAVALAGVQALAPVHRASAILRLSSDAPLVSGRPYNLDYADRLMNTYIEIATTAPVRAELAGRLVSALRIDLSSTGERDRWLATLDALELEVENLANTELLQIAAEHPDPVVAATAADAMASILVELSGGVAETGRAPDAEGDLVFSVVEAAEIPTTPVAARRGLILAAGLFGGLIAGLGLGFLTENLDRRVHSVEQAEALTGADVLGRIPQARHRRRASGAIWPIDAAGSDALRQVRSKLFAIRRTHPLDSLLIASCASGEGKSTIAINLAAALAEAGQRVLVVDADLRSPDLHRRFDLPDGKGLSDLLLLPEKPDRQEILEFVQESGLTRVHLLTCGWFLESPSTLLSSPRVCALIGLLEQHYDWVLIDTPALSVAADAVVLAPAASGVLLVLDSHRIAEDVLGECREHLADTGARLVGVVMNRVRDPRGSRAGLRPL